jgi:hypothetical protein
MPAGVDPAVAEYFARRQALRIGEDEGWFEIVGVDEKTGRGLTARPGRYAFNLAAGGERRQRVMLHDEVFWWCLGLGDAVGQGGLVLQPPPIPEILSFAEAAEQLGLTEDGLAYRIRDAVNSRLHPVRPHGERELLAVEVRAAARPDDPEAQAEWVRLQEVWPLYGPIPAGFAAGAGPYELAVPAPMPSGVREMFALNRASEAALVRYLYADRDRDVYAATVVVDEGLAVTRELTAKSVLPWLQGIADQRNQPEVTTYRQGLL